MEDCNCCRGARADDEEGDAADEGLSPTRCARALEVVLCRLT